jgi:hypothetical protein
MANVDYDEEVGLLAALREPDPKRRRWVGAVNQLCHAKFGGQAAWSDDLDAAGEWAFGQVDAVSRADHICVAGRGGRDEVEVIGVELACDKPQLIG